MTVPVTPSRVQLHRVPTSIGEPLLSTPGSRFTDLRDLDLDHWFAAVRSDELRLTAHAIQRYRERIEPLPRRSAYRALARLARQVTVTGRPPEWLAGALTPRAGFGLADGRPELCLVIVDDAVVTVLRSVLRDERQPHRRDRIKHLGRGRHLFST